jgi:hypothetical protein
MTVKMVKSLWIDEELKYFIVERDDAKGLANTVHSESIQTS